MIWATSAGSFLSNKRMKPETPNDSNEPTAAQDFTAIFRLISSLEEPEVAARDADTVPEEIWSMIKLFAAGNIDSKDRERVVEQLASNPRWIAHLANEIKAQSTGSSVLKSL